MLASLDCKLRHRQMNDNRLKSETLVGCPLTSSRFTHLECRTSHGSPGESGAPGIFLARRTAWRNEIGSYARSRMPYIIFVRWPIPDTVAFRYCRRTVGMATWLPRLFSPLEPDMKIRILVATAIAAMTLSAGAANAAGCIKGAAVGGVAGHVAGHHGVAGAAVGCVVGRHRAKVKAKNEAAQAASSNSSAASTPANVPVTPAAR